jgi:hypothetical protein
MKLLISGEGASDIGTCINAQGTCMDDAFLPGPMTIWLKRMLEQLLDYDLLSVAEAVIYVHKNVLVEDAKQSGRRMQRLRGKDKEAETSYFYGNAEQLGKRAKALSDESASPVIAVLFRDADETCGTPGQLWQTKWDSIVSGFKAAGFEFGVPMLPKPKSEAWLLCAATQSNHSHAELENISGNDKSPNSAKIQLDETLGRHYSSTELAVWCQCNPIEWSQLRTMPSFAAFVNRFEKVVSAICKRPLNSLI